MEKETDNKTSQQRKKRSANGTRAQKMVTFRLDYENEDWLNQQPNKGRYLNELIQADRAKKQPKG